MSRSTMKKRAAGAGAGADEYLELVRRFPLRPIRTRPDYERATTMLADLVGRADTGLSPAESDYADVLARLVREYDERRSGLLREPSGAGRMSPVEALRLLVDEHRMNTVSLGRLVGGSGQASMILSGKRQLSKANIRTLAAHFKVSPALFI